jgi:broad specificity phosphatase PhoE
MDASKKYTKYKTKNKYLKLKKHGKMKEIYFIRHGQTLWNKLGKTQGFEADIELNENGINEATITGKYLKEFRLNGKKFDCIISSSMLRCKQTTDMIAKELDFDQKIIFNDDIKEVKKGNMSGLTNSDELIIQFNKCVDEQINKIKDPIEKYEIDNPYKAEDFYEKIIEENNLNIVGVEKTDELIHRITKFLKLLKKTKCEKIIVVTHSGILDILLQIIFKINVLPKGNMSNSKNCSICYCTLKNKSFTMISPQNTEHLKK